MFEVTLLRVPSVLGAQELLELEDNACRHVEGRYWIMEGDPGYLSFLTIPIAEGITSGLHRDDVPDGQPIIDHAVHIFRLGSWPPPRY